MSGSTTPARAWAQMRRGNTRFVDGTPRHPRQDADRRQELAAQQSPDVALFGCADSRLAAEIIFDKGLGDLFVVRNAGQVISDSVIGSLEYAVQVLGVPLIVVLAHDHCGAVRAAIDAGAPGAAEPSRHIATIVDAIEPAVAQVRRVTADGAAINPAAVGERHLRHTVIDLVRSSDIISDAVSDGTLGIVGANYELVDGRVTPTVVFGDIDHASDRGEAERPRTGTPTQEEGQQ